jgi:plastocyanin
MRHRGGWTVVSIGAGIILAIAGVAPVLAATRNVSIAGFAFSPDPVTIHVGDKVSWTNNDGVVHNATGTAPGFATGQIATGTSKAVTFNVAGTYPYHCTVHPAMTGTVIVLAASAGGTPDTDMASLDPGRDGTWLSIVLAALGVVMLIGTLVVERLLRHRTS